MFAQTTVGGVKGTVLDPAEAVVPGATVTLLNIQTNTSRQTESSAVGLYDFTDVPPGKYQLTVEIAGFKKWSGDLELQIQQVAVVDPTLVVGNVAQTIEVTAVTPVISHESSSLAGVADSARIREVALNGMDVTQLFQLVPGVEVGHIPRTSTVCPRAMPTYSRTVAQSSTSARRIAPDQSRPGLYSGVQC